MPKSPSLASYVVSRRWTVVEARAVVQALDASGLSVRAFAASKGLDAERLYRWRRHLRAADGQPALPAFVEVKSAFPVPVEVVLRSGRVLRVAESIDAGSLRVLVAVLEEEFAC